MWPDDVAFVSAEIIEHVAIPLFTRFLKLIMRRGTVSPVMYRVRWVEVVIISGLPRHVFVCLENTVYYRVTMCHVDV